MNSIKRNNVAGARINIPINFTGYNMIKQQRTRGLYSL